MANFSSQGNYYIGLDSKDMPEAYTKIRTNNNQNFYVFCFHPLLSLDENILGHQKHARSSRSHGRNTGWLSDDTVLDLVPAEEGLTQQALIELMEADNGEEGIEIRRRNPRGAALGHGVIPETGYNFQVVYNTNTPGRTAQLGRVPAGSNPFTVFNPGTTYNLTALMEIHIRRGVR